jgi:4-hydroxythreonine-4-phosphate dehydrogenase
MKRVMITPGEPAGIGPDVVLLTLARASFPAACAVVADPGLLAQRAELLGLSIDIKIISDPGCTPSHVAGSIYCLPVSLARPAIPGELNVSNAPYVVETLRIASQACLSKQVDALVTGPVQKSVINDAGIVFSGHTEFFAQEANITLPVMVLESSRLRVALLTTHLPLSAVPSAVTQERLLSTLAILHPVYSRILVCGLNPHAGENGHLGREEIEVIRPAIELAQASGIQVDGPYSADTIFLQEADIILAMYHDQALPVIKYSGFGEVVNITLGLPYLRTSVDHGTALALAGTGNANPSSFSAALHRAIVNQTCF